jgi:methylmalonyl-CoA/ethylmalonyl-CoA epimerase
MKSIALHHVGIVFPDEATVSSFANLFGLEEEYRGYVPEYKSLCIFMKGNGRSAIEFVIPDGGNLAGYNSGKGGIHHIALLVDDVIAAKQELNQRGIELLEEVPVQGAGNFVVNFVRPRNAHRVLVEFIEETK